MTGLEKLRKAVDRDIEEQKGFHDFEAKFNWVIERAKHYAEKTGKSYEEIIDIWEDRRTYWYMNYYQDCKQPLLTADGIMMYDEWKKKLNERFGENPMNWKFKCPNCGNIQSLQDFVNARIDNAEGKFYYSCIGRYVKDKGCNWTLGGLFQIHKTAIFKDGVVVPVFEMAETEDSSNV